MAKLNQIIAIEKGIKSKTHSDFTELYKVVQKPALFNGFTKTYKPNDEEGDTFPDERQRVQYKVNGVLDDGAAALTDLLNVTARKDFTNTVAKASVVVDGTTILADAPVSYLLFLEKQLTDFRTFVDALPTLDEAEDWNYDANTGLYRSAENKTLKTKKSQKAIVLYPATTEHPAQTQLITEDITIGYWHQTKHSGAIEAPKKAELLSRVDKLLIAVKESREAANLQEEVATDKIGETIFNYLLS
jgi:hypothetical protein